MSFEPLDNGFRSVEGPDLAQRVCARLSADHLRLFVAKWTRRLLGPWMTTLRSGAATPGWSASSKVSDTVVFDRPGSGRAWFEAAIRDTLDLGRPEKVTVIFDRNIRRRGSHPSPGRFTTEVITPGADPLIQVCYRASKAEAYLKDRCALRVETTINDPL